MKTDTLTPTEQTDSGRAEKSAPRTISLSLNGIFRFGVVAVVVLLIAGLAWLWLAARSDLGALETRDANNAKAEQVATEYAVGASTIDYKDFNAWAANLKHNATPQLANKFDASAPALQQILSPLQWTSTAVPITAKVMSVKGDEYKVNVFLNVTSTNAQVPDGGQTTVTYNVILDKSLDWKITDVGGMEGALPVN